MNLNLLSVETEIFSYISTNFVQDPELTFIDDFLDFDKYKKSNQCFIQFPSGPFDALTNESTQVSLDMDVYFVCRNDTASDLKTRVLTYAQNFYNFFYEDPTLGGIIDIGSISNFDFFEAVEGNTNLKLLRFPCVLRYES